MSLQERWSSGFYFILAATGAAVGLGSIWKFPYEAGLNGGGLFVTCYLIFILLVGIPALVAEMSIGVIGRRNPVEVFTYFHQTIGTSMVWQWLGYLSLLTLILIFSFYSVIAGWDLDYLVWSLNESMAGLSPSQIQSHWQSLQSSFPRMLFYHSLFSILTGLVVIFPIKKGLERATKMLMPLLFLLVIILVLMTLSMSGLHDAIAYLFNFSWEHLSAKMILEALGNACFTLAIGAGCMLVYGAYLPQGTRMISVAFWVALLNAFVALMSGLAIFTIVFTYQLDPRGGPGLMFETLPLCFSQHPGGDFFAIGFFALLFLAAWTSAISLIEPLVTYLMQSFHLPRVQAATLATVVGWALGLGTIFSFNIEKNIGMFGFANFFEMVSYLTTNVFLNVGIIAYTLFAGWCLKRQSLQMVLNTKNEIFNVWYLQIKYILPLIFIVILIRTMI